MNKLPLKFWDRSVILKIGGHIANKGVGTGT